MKFEIDAYRFGHITINSMAYEGDLIIGLESITPRWWRAEGHTLSLGDLGAALAELPDVVIVGTGAQGQLHVPSQLIEEVRRHYGIDLVAMPTEQAVNEYNARARRGERVAAALHLTC